MAIHQKAGASFLLAIIFLAPALHAEFSTRSLGVQINMNLDGSANVEEQLYMVVNGTQSRDNYEIWRSAYTNLSTWQQRLNISDLRYHVTWVAASVSDVRITPQALEGCNSFIEICYSKVVLSYKVLAWDQNGSGLVRADSYKPRTTRYSLVPEALSFEQTKSGDLILPKGTTITFTIPQAAQKIYFSSIPSNVADEGQDALKYDSAQNVRYYVGNSRSFIWKGDTLPKFSFTYEVEEQLESEVMEFFATSQSSVIAFLLGPQGTAAMFIVLVAAVSFYYFNRMGKEA